jgi:hypothetical protein
MIEGVLPDTEAVPELVRSFAACVASVTETPCPRCRSLALTSVGQLLTGEAGWRAEVPGWSRSPTLRGSTVNDGR